MPVPKEIVKEKPDLPPDGATLNYCAGCSLFRPEGGLWHAEQFEDLAMDVGQFRVEDLNGLVVREQ
jgi:hypothetical protein